MNFYFNGHSSAPELGCNDPGVYIPYIDPCRHLDSFIQNSLTSGIVVRMVCETEPLDQGRGFDSGVGQLFRRRRRQNPRRRRRQNNKFAR